MSVASVRESLMVTMASATTLICAAAISWWAAELGLDGCAARSEVVIA